MSNKIMVLGATGNVGNPLVQLLRNRKADFCIGVKLNSELPQTIGDIETIPIDYDDVRSVKTALTNIDSLFILLPDSPFMVDQMTNINNGILNSGITNYIYLSGAGVKIAPDTWLSQKLTQCEELLRSNQLPGTILRPTFFMQNFINHYPPVDCQMYMPIENGAINYIDVNDIALAACEILLKSSPNKQEVEVYHLTGTKSLNMVEIAELFSDVLNNQYGYVPISKKESMERMKEKNQPEWLISMLHQIYTKVSENLYAFTTSDLQSITKKEPKGFLNFIEENKEFFNKQISN